MKSISARWGANFAPVFSLQEKFWTLTGSLAVSISRMPGQRAGSLVEPPEKTEQEADCRRRQDGILESLPDAPEACGRGIPCRIVNRLAQHVHGFDQRF